ncbi:hypothetical protein [Sediminicoccus sp. KRV36]|uniref:hypothetical protein n=1 Tax=Sediminicoccus sp. KRV36 TaxID=3133721 RepID=UPI002010B94B|nr:hypothetical protein [Sediminicoccus rosea]UPY35353.1 hypothetical protein LHU95_14085 [Sediminicoccus rosea]
MAEILPFPHKPEDRLRAALRCLDDALTEQKLAFTEFRTNLAALGGAVAGLESSVQNYRGTLAATQQDVAKSHAAARRLEATAEIWLNQAR